MNKQNRKKSSGQLQSQQSNNYLYSDRSKPIDIDANGSTTTILSDNPSNQKPIRVKYHSQIMSSSDSDKENGKTGIYKTESVNHKLSSITPEHQSSFDINSLNVIPEHTRNNNSICYNDTAC